MKIPSDSAAGKYLRDRGVDPEFAARERVEGNRKIELVTESFEAAEYLGLKEEQLKWDFDSELLCFPLYPWGWLTKRFPVPTSGSGKGFRVTLGLKGHHPIFIPEPTWAVRRDAREPIFWTEGPVKALALRQAGVLSIGLIGTYASEFCDGRRLRQLQEHLRERFEWFGRRVYFAFDADQQFKTGVRRSVIRNYMLLTVLGADVRQLCWPIEEGKGIDDYLYRKAHPNA